MKGGGGGRGKAIGYDQQILQLQLQVGNAGHAGTYIRANRSSAIVDWLIIMHKLRIYEIWEQSGTNYTSIDHFSDVINKLNFEKKLQWSCERRLFNSAASFDHTLQKRWVSTLSLEAIKNFANGLSKGICYFIRIQISCVVLRKINVWPHNGTACCLKNDALRLQASRFSRLCSFFRPSSALNKCPCQDLLEKLLLLLVLHHFLFSIVSPLVSDEPHSPPPPPAPFICIHPFDRFSSVV